MQTTYCPPEAAKLIAERDALNDEKLHALYQEHRESPYVTYPLSEAQFARVYRRFLNVEIAAWKALESGDQAAYFNWDNESQRLCAMLGY